MAVGDHQHVGPDEGPLHVSADVGHEGDDLKPAIAHARAVVAGQGDVVGEPDDVEPQSLGAGRDPEDGLVLGVLLVVGDGYTDLHGSSVGEPGVPMILTAWASGNQSVAALAFAFVGTPQTV